MSKGDYEVGYGRPPKAHQFKPGQSGCMTGRRSEKGAVALDLDALLEAPGRYIDASGRQRRAPRQELLFRAQVERSLRGDLRALKAVLKRFIAYEALELGREIHDYGAIHVPRRHSDAARTHPCRAVRQAALDHQGDRPSLRGLGPRGAGRGQSLHRRAPRKGRPMSGNNANPPPRSRGRAEGAKGRMAMVQKIAREKRRVKLDGKWRRVTTVEAPVLALTARAASSDHALEMLLKLQDQLGDNGISGGYLLAPEPQSPEEWIAEQIEANKHRQPPLLPHEFAEHNEADAKEIAEAKKRAARSTRNVDRR